MKNCSRIKIDKCAHPSNPQPKSNFRSQEGRRDGLRSQCRSCETMYTRANSVQSADRARKWYRENKERQRLYKIKKQYGLEPVEYFDMMEKQKKACWICKVEKKLVVDHCHKTGKVRGLLCNCCNRGLGFFSDKPERLLSAVEYLKKD